MTPNRIRPEDRVKVQIIDTEGNERYVFTGTGYHDVAGAIMAAYEASGIDQDARDFAYQVSNLADGTSARYRLNAHDNVRLVV